MHMTRTRCAPHAAAMTCAGINFNISHMCRKFDILFTRNLVNGPNSVAFRKECVRYWALPSERPEELTHVQWLERCRTDGPGPQG